MARLIEAATERKVCRVLYFSVHSDREKDYELHPYSLAYAEGGLYLSAWVPEYRMVRVFAAERIRRVTVLEKSFTPAVDMADDAFGQSLGVNRTPTFFINGRKIEGGLDPEFFEAAIEYELAHGKP